jgi:dolichyl-phosphate-mannose-protein mannosyltransferase
MAASGVGGYLLLNYALNWLPWAKVTRCTFMYHHMGSAAFGFLALAWLLAAWLQLSPEDYPQAPRELEPSYDREWRLAGLAVFFLVALAFIWWLPLFLGLPLSPTEYKFRMWMPSWV